MIQIGEVKVEEVGSPTWTRTRDKRINSPLLYQLSYQGTCSSRGRYIIDLPLVGQ